MGMGCCENVTIVGDEKIVKIDGWSFKIYLTFCSNCGKLKPVTCRISEGYNDRSKEDR